MRETVQVRISDYGRGCSLNALRANTLTTRHVMFQIKKLAISALASALVCSSMCLKKRNFKNTLTQLNSKTRPNTIEFDGFKYARLVDMHRLARILKHIYTCAYEQFFDVCRVDSKHRCCACCYVRSVVHGATRCRNIPVAD